MNKLKNKAFHIVVLGPTFRRAGWRNWSEISKINEEGCFCT